MASGGLWQLACTSFHHARHIRALGIQSTWQAGVLALQDGPMQQNTATCSSPHSQNSSQAHSFPCSHTTWTPAVYAQSQAVTNAICPLPAAPLTAHRNEWSPMQPPPSTWARESVNPRLTSSILTCTHASIAAVSPPMRIQHFSTQPNAQPASGFAGQGVLGVLPSAFVPYAQLMRLDKPIGTWLLLWPCLWSIALAASPGDLPDLWVTSLFSLGALLLRGAGCTINDLWDRDLDTRVERTRTRPLAAGVIQPWQAVAFLGLQLSLGLCILLELNTYSQVLGASSLLLVGTYPLMKRVTYWPQAVLGLTINWGALLGWAAVRGDCDWSVVLPLYTAGVCWSLVYDTIYAHQDKRDDVAANIRSTALLFGSRTKPILTGFATLQITSLVVAGMAAGVGPAYYAGVAGMGAHLAWQLFTVDLDNGPQCSQTFMSNKWAGAILFAGCVAGRIIP